MASNAAFVGSVPGTYHEFLGPLIFEDYARDLAGRVRPAPGARILELACGTGIVTRRLSESLPRGASLTATDLNDSMLDVARGTAGTAAGVTFQRVDACVIPFGDGSFDRVVCQFGVMFFPDKARAMREARRVLAPGGVYLFNVWDSLEHNPIPKIVHETVAARFPSDPPMFLAAAPYAWFDRAEIERTVRAGGFTRCDLETLEFPCAAPTAEHAARGFLEGTPLLPALQERGVSDPSGIRAQVARALAERFGDGPCRATMRAIVVRAE